MRDNDLISRAAAIQAARHAWAKGLEPSQYIEIMPAVDAEPVRHGRWIEDRTDIVCSVCGARYKDEIVFIPDACMSGQLYDGLEHCPHCGAKLDGGELNDT